MALPDNGHHVHSDGYSSEKGNSDPMRLIEDVADEIEQEPSVTAVYPDEDLDGPYIEVEYEPDYVDGSRFEQIETIAEDYGCRVTTVSDDDGLLSIRPE
jgi:hypothetical protein